jgi:hypothetical protein
MMWWDWRLRTSDVTGLLFIPQVNVSAEPWWWWCQLGMTLDLSTRACWQSYQQRHLERVGGMDEWMRILRIQYLWYVNGSFTCHKILRHGTSGFTSHLNEGVLWVFIALKNPSPWLGLNPRPLRPVVNTLTTIPLRRLDNLYISIIILFEILEKNAGHIWYNKYMRFWPGSHPRQFMWNLWRSVSWGRFFSRVLRLTRQ